METRITFLSVDQSEVCNSQVVIAGRGSSKGSVLGFVVGYVFLSEGNNIATRTPIKPTLIHTDAPRKGVDSSLLPVSGRSRTPPISSNLTNPDLTTLVDGAVSNEPTDLRIYSSRVSDPASTEFAGYIQIPFANQPNPHEERVTALCERYIKEPKIILTVRAADIESTPQLCGLAGG